MLMSSTPTADPAPDPIGDFFIGLIEVMDKFSKPRSWSKPYRRGFLVLLPITGPIYLVTMTLATLLGLIFMIGTIIWIWAECIWGTEEDDIDE